MQPGIQNEKARIHTWSGHRRGSRDILQKMGLEHLKTKTKPTNTNNGPKHLQLQSEEWKHYNTHSYQDKVNYSHLFEGRHSYQQMTLITLEGLILHFQLY